MRNMENRTDFERLGVAIRALIQGFRREKPEEIQQPRIAQELGDILQLAQRLGDPLYAKAKELKNGFSRYIKHPGKREFAEQFMKLALLLEQETREI